MRRRKNLIAGLVTLLAVICCAAAWEFFRTKTNVRASSPHQSLDDDDFRHNAEQSSL
jgi:hypothetical protein